MTTSKTNTADLLPLRSGAVKEIVPIFFTLDESYVPWLSVALCSMKENASPDRHYKIHIVAQDIPADLEQKLSAIADENFEILFSDMPRNLDMIKDASNNYLRADYFTLTIFFRLFLPELFPEYDKAIYLDSDTCIPGDIATMYDIDLGDNYLGVVNDFSIADKKPLTDYVEQAVGIDKTSYFNSGVLLMNFKALREHHLSERFLELLEKYGLDTIAPDQDYLNALCKDKLVHLDRKYDAMPSAFDEIEAPVIIHYNLFDKPWCYDNVQYEDYFWNYAKKSGFLEEIQAFKDNYPEERKQQDKAALDELVHKALVLPHADMTFKSLFESGTEERL